MSAYLQRGEGRDLVFLHGYLSSKESFYPQISYFSRFYKVTAFDFPGFGQGEMLESAWSVDDYADWTERFLNGLGIQNPLAVAHSFGGRVAIKCLSRGDFPAAALIGSAGIVPRRTLSYRARVKAYRVIKKVFPGYAERRFGSKEYRSLSPVMRESYKKIVNEDLREQAAGILQPVLFINGENDKDTPPSYARIFHSYIKNSRVVTVENAGHFVHLERTEEVNLAIEEFFQCLNQT